MHRSCRLLDFTGWNVGSGLRDRLATKTATTSRSFARGRARQADDGPKDADERFYGYAKKLEVKNQAKDVEADEEEIRQRVYRRTHSPEESVLAVDLVRKHKATKRDAKRLRRMHRETPERTKRLANFKVLPFSHCDPSSDRMVRSIVHQLRKADGVDKETEKMEITDSQLVKLEESEKESVGSLEDLELRHGSPRPPRPDRSNDPLSLPLSRPSLEAFHQVQPDNKDHLDTHFAEWFIGITEAQLPFKVGPNGRPYFALHHSDKQFFRKIRSLLHFGHADDTKEIFYVKDDKHLPCIIHLLNGNLFLQRSRDTFREWVQRYKDLGVWQDEGFVFKETCQWRPQLNNKWLMGWIDSSYGLFAGRLVESGTFPYFRIQLKFWLLSDDRSLLEHMKAIFGGGDIEEDGDWLRWTVRERKLHIRVNRSVFAHLHTPAESLPDTVECSSHSPLRTSTWVVIIAWCTTLSQRSGRSVLGRSCRIW